MSHWIKTLVLALSVMTLVTAAWADESTGKVQKVDRDQRMIVLEDGTELWVAEGVSLDSVSEGKEVKVMFEEKDGKKVATQVDVTN
jgi:hypothetical protein